jgi:hypothetical protein
MDKGLRGSWPRATTIALIALVAAFMLTACGAASGPTGLLQGTVTLGPISPVEQVGAPPNTRPYAATIDVETPGGDVVATVSSGEDGDFAVRLPAGSYRLVPRSPEGQPLPRATPLGAAVAADGTTTVTIAYDTGIR